MKVKELIILLGNCEQEAEVYNGNGAKINSVNQPLPNSVYVEHEQDNDD